MNDRRLQILISGWLDESIEPEEFHNLQATLKESASARSVYLAYVNVDDELFELATDNSEHPQANTVEDTKLGDRNGSSGGGILFAPRSLAFVGAIAAGLLVALGIWLGTDRGNQELVQGRAANELPILVKIEPVSDSCRWHVENARRPQAASHRSGDIIRVTSGKLSLHYASGTTVVLHAPSAYQLISDQDARILVGRLTANVSEAGIGFSVLTPRAAVIDLGTEFGIDVNDYGATDVVVFKGKVDVDYYDNRVNAQRLRMGEALHLDAAGTASRVASITNSTYSIESQEETSRPLVITQVRDNIERTLSLNYYEIVREGMGEDAIAYVDRESHQYNGITKEGLPPYLVGGDYVKMFNSDKDYNRDIRISVKLSVPAKLYILVDDRITPAEWLLENFRDTGDNVGIERGPYVSGGRQIGTKVALRVGPGLGVDDTLSVWVRDIPEPGVVTLGAVMLSGTNVRKTGCNMYGIVAVPRKEGP